MNCPKCDELRAELERVKGLRLADTVIFNTEMERVKAKVYHMQILLADVGEMEDAIEKMCAGVLGQAFVDGDSTSVPGPEACVAEVVRRIEDLRRELAEARNQVAELIGWNTGKPPKFVSIAGFERVQKQCAAMVAALTQINELRFQPHGVHDRFARALELAENALAQAKALGLE